MKATKNKTIAVLGLWHLGIIIAVGLAKLGHTIIAFDSDAKKIIDLKNGIPPLFEPDLETYLRECLLNQKITFTDSFENIKSADIIYFAFDTPLNEKDEVDTSLLFHNAKEVAAFIKNNAIIVVSSQVPIGTTEQLCKKIAKKNKKLQFTIAYQPENLRLGKAFERFFNPAMIVIGSEDQKTFQKVRSLYNKIPTKKIQTSIKTAEFIKHAINTYLATSISYANELGNIADLVGADFYQASEILRLDERIGSFARISPGLGFAGGTLARDLKILQNIGETYNYEPQLINSILSINEWQKKSVVRKLQEIFKNNLKNKKIGILGLTYTPQTSTLRRSLAVEVIHHLLQEKVNVLAYDPKVDKTELGRADGIEVTSSAYALAKNSDAMVLMTEWPEFVDLDFQKIKDNMKNALFLDPKNFLVEKNLSSLGFTYIGLGRGECT